MDPIIKAAATVAASPYLTEAAKGAANKVGEAAYEGGAKLLAFLKRKLTSENEQKALNRVELEPEDPDSQAALRVVLKESPKQDIPFREELEVLLKRSPRRRRANQRTWSATATSLIRQPVKASKSRLATGSDH
jgi:hypothetical protein